MGSAMARSRDPEKLVLENLKLRGENRKLKSEAKQLRARLVELADRIDELNVRQASVVEAAERTEGLMRWLRARMEAMERELGK
jgi:predicted nuclease with TOPRIM domain